MSRTSSRRRCLASSVVLAVVALAGCTSGDGRTDGAGSSPAAQALPDLTDCPAPTGAPATGEQTLPVLSLPCLDGEGGALTLGEAPGVPLVLNLWATWCTSCRDELPLFSQLYGATDRAELLVAGVVTRDGAGLAAEFVTDLGIDFPSGLDENGDLYVDQGLRGLPGTFFVNADGSIAHAELAPITSYEDLLALLQEHLGVSV
ncbi:MAG: TlpA family protein disulfide reductase [Actinomycetota bacterium]|nr:TlpA family protein disulfide reductase [Geodermatophilaceae bacterium]MDQ3504893.1 TlpA family protein disulfide reductase [Actinomycetota bacterium]